MQDLILKKCYPFRAAKMEHSRKSGKKNLVHLLYRYIEKEVLVLNYEIYILNGVA